MAKAVLSNARIETILLNRDFHLKVVGMGSAARESLQVPASPLLKKARELGLQLPLDLERLAIARGCD